MKIHPILSTLVVTSFFFACRPSGKENEDAGLNNENPKQEMHAHNSVTVKTFANDSLLTGFGYDIYMDSSAKPTVHQPNIPAVAGNRGFSTEGDAKKTGEYVANKIKNNIMPPSVTVQELDSLGVK